MAKLEASLEILLERMLWNFKSNLKFQKQFALLNEIPYSSTQHTPMFTGTRKKALYKNSKIKNYQGSLRVGFFFPPFFICFVL